MQAVRHSVENVHPVARGGARWLRRGALIAVLALGAGAAAPARALQAADYFPLEPGNSWTYQTPMGSFTLTVLPGTVDVKGEPTRVVEHTVGGSPVTRFHYTVDARGLRTHRISFPMTDSSWTFDPPYAVLPPGDFSVGTQLMETSSIFVTGVTGPLPPHPHLFSNQLRVAGFETVEVPAGTFTALVIENDGSQFGSPVSSTMWFVEGIGIVKKVSGGVVEELTATTVPEPAAGAGAALVALAGMAARRRARPVR